MFVIKVTGRVYRAHPFVSGFNREHQVVVYSNRQFAKVFKTEQAAQRFIRNHADIGYGLQSKACKIINSN